MHFLWFSHFRLNNWDLLYCCLFLILANEMIKRNWQYVKCAFINNFSFFYRHSRLVNIFFYFLTLFSFVLTISVSAKQLIHVLQKHVVKYITSKVYFLGAFHFQWEFNSHSLKIVQKALEKALLHELFESSRELSLRKKAQTIAMNETFSK